MNDYGYGLWPLMAISTAVVLIFAASFFQPQGKRDWTAFGGFSAFIVGGFWLISAGWRVLYDAHKAGHLAVEGPYARIRHPQYSGFILIMVGFLLQWPTLPARVMFLALLYVYRRLAIGEEREVRERFGFAWDRYAAGLPRFVPRRGRRVGPLPTMRPNGDAASHGH